MQVQINTDEMTLGQIEFIEDYSEVALLPLIEMIQDGGGIPTRALVAILAVQMNPAHPEAGLASAREIKIKEIQLGG